MNLSTKIKLDKAAQLAHEASLLLNEVKQEFADNDLTLLNRTQSDLNWATENCTLLGLHSIGQNISDQP